MSDASSKCFRGPAAVVEASTTNVCTEALQMVCQRVHPCADAAVHELVDELQRALVVHLWAKRAEAPILRTF